MENFIWNLNTLIGEFIGDDSWNLPMDFKLAFPGLAERIENIKLPFMPLKNSLEIFGFM